MDEPCSALDPIATREDRGADAASSRRSYTIVIVTHNMQQAARVSDRTAFFMLLGGWSSSGRPTRDLHQPGETSRPRTTSPAASARSRSERRAHGTAFRRGAEGDPRDQLLLMGGAGRGRSSTRRCEALDATATRRSAQAIFAARPGDRPARDRDRRALHHALLAAPPADGHGPALHHSALKITTDLERVGDQAVNIAAAAVRAVARAPAQAADRHPAHGRARPGDADARRSTRSCARRRGGARGPHADDEVDEPATTRSSASCSST